MRISAMGVWGECRVWGVKGQGGGDGLSFGLRWGGDERGCGDDD